MGQVAAELSNESHDSASFLPELTRLGPRDFASVNIKPLLPLVSSFDLILAGKSYLTPINWHTK